MRSKPAANLPGFSDSAASADGRRGQRRRDSSPAHGILGLLEAGLLRPSPESPSYRTESYSGLVSAAVARHGFMRS